MTPLTTNRRIFTWMSVFPPENGSSKWKRIAYVFVTLALYSQYIVSFFASVSFFREYMTSDPEQVPFALIQCVAFSALFYAVLRTYLLRRQVVVIFGMLTKIYDKRNKVIVLE